MSSIRVTCLRCNSVQDCPESDAGKTVLCPKCFSNLRVPAVVIPTTMEIEIEDVACRKSHEDFFTAGESNARMLSVSHTTPAAPPTQAKDPDKALANTALGLFRLNNWPCQEDPGYKSFTVTVKVSTPQRGVLATDNYKVHAENGLLIIESLIIELPELPGVPLLEALNEINQRSVSSVFILQEGGVLMRHTCIPRSKEEGFFSVKMLAHTIKQMYYDRRHALSLLRKVIEDQRIDPMGIVEVFSRPVPMSVIGNLSNAQAADLAGFAGFHAQSDQRGVYVAREVCRPEVAPVKLAACPGYLCAWVSLGDTSNGHYTWTSFPKKIRSLLKNVKAMSVGKLGQLYQHLNTLNAESPMLRFVTSRNKIMAMAMLAPTDQPITVEQFKVFADALLDYAETGTQAPSSAIMAKVAG